MSSLIERLQNGEKVKCQVRDDGLEKWEEAEVWSYDGYLLHSYRGDPRANSAFWRYARVLDEIDEEPTDTMPEELPVAPSEQKTDEKQYNINTARIADGEITGETQEERFKRLTEVKADAKQVGGDHYKTFKIQPYQFCYENKLNNLQSEVVSYVARYDRKWKDSIDKQVEDLEKAKHTIELLIEKIKFENS